MPTQSSDPLELIEAAVNACLEGLEDFDEDLERRETYVRVLRDRLHRLYSDGLH